MNVLLVAQCHKNALKETRRILDQFAERRGDRTWQTPITQAGLKTLRQLLRKTARKNTAVACHWIRGHNQSELIWIVGDASRFNEQGAVPTNTTGRDILRRQDENDWHSGQLIHLLASMAALFHDVGKASDAFQKRLTGQLQGRNVYRHEWTSLRILEAFVGDDDDDGWLTRLQQGGDETEAALDEPLGWLARLQCDGRDPDINTQPFKRLPPLAAAVGWLVVSHHRLPALPVYTDDGRQQKRVGAKAVLNGASVPSLPEAIKAAWNERLDPHTPDEIKPYWSFSKGLPMSSQPWRVRAARLARQLQSLKCAQPPLDMPYVMHLARLSLMLADHHYSSLTTSGRLTGKWSNTLFANTAYLQGRRQMNQPLDEHLVGVTRAAGEIAHRLPDMLTALPRIARHKGFKARSTIARFRWQDKAFDLATGLRDKSRAQGFFGINMASTGCGKTIANGRIAYALNDPEQGARFSIALGLRTLTLQTGQVYRERLGLGSDDLAIRVGGSAVRALFEHQQLSSAQTFNSHETSSAQQASSALPSAGGSESRGAFDLLDEQSHVHFEGQLEAHPVLSRMVVNPQARALITAPVLVSTIDHLMPATESLRGGHQLAPMLRLMSSDLILDEPDDFALEDLSALTRLVYWAALLGSRVILSSATLPPALVRGLFDAYRAGRAEYQQHRGLPGAPVEPLCAWFDEYGCTHQACAEGAQFDAAHQDFAQQRIKRLAEQPVLRQGYRVPLVASSAKPEAVCAALVETLLPEMFQLHRAHHSQDPGTQKSVSFGLIRMANIEPLVRLARALYESEIPEGWQLHLCVYHSQFPLVLRSRLEAHLDRVLDRRDPEAVFAQPEIRARLNGPAEHHVFIVLGSPVTEVGRDHDYDWAIVEPSSMRSIVQLAGRIRRHRLTPVSSPNIALLDTNVRHLQRKTPAFSRPGFESDDWPLNTHRLSQLLPDDTLAAIDARPRLLPNEPLNPTTQLVDLEHARLKALMVEEASLAQQPSRRKRRSRLPVVPLGAYLFFRPASMNLCALAIQNAPFRWDPTQQDEWVLLPDEDETDYVFCRVDRADDGEHFTPVEHEVTRLSDHVITHPRIKPWNEPDYLTALAAQADAMELSLAQCAKRFGRVRLTRDYAPNGWCFHPALGFVRRE